MRCKMETVTVKIHDTEPRLALDQYVEISKRAHPTKPSWWTTSLGIVDGEKPYKIEVMSEGMTPDGAKSRATELAISKGFEHVIIRESKESN